MNNYSDSIETDYCSDSSLEDDFSFGMQGNHRHKTDLVPLNQVLVAH